MDFFKNFGEKMQTNFEIVENSSRKMLNQMRGVESTVDETFEVARKNFQSHLSIVEKLLESVAKQGKGLKSLQGGIANMAGQLVEFNSSDNRIGGATEFVNSADALKSSVNIYLEQTKQVEANLKQLLSQLKDVERHVLERDRLLLDYDKNRHEIAKAKDATSLAALQKRFETAKELYERRNFEVREEINTLYYNRNLHTEVQVFIQALAAFFTSGGQSFNALVTRMQQYSPPKETYVPQVMKPTPPMSASTYVPTNPPPPATNNMAGSASPYSGMNSMNRTVGPQPTPVVGLKKARALYPFTGETDSELSFMVGDIITIINADHPEWWQGELRGKRGELPANYVELLP